MTWLTLLILALAVSRLSRLIVHDSITEPIRAWVWKRWPGSSTEFGDSEVHNGILATGVDVFRADSMETPGTRAWYATRPRFIGELISCHWCLSVWVAIVVWGAWCFYHDLQWFLVPFAFSEVTGLLNDD